MEHLERLIIDLKESLEREIRANAQEMREGFAIINSRFDSMEARLDRHGALLQTGGRFTNRIVKWAEKVDSSQMRQDREITELRDRVRRLESGEHGKQS